MSTELFLNFLGIRMDSRKAEGMRFTINLITPDNGEKFLVELENATLTNIKGFLAAQSRPDTDHQPVGSGADDDGREERWTPRSRTARRRRRATSGILKRLAATMVDFDPRFEIMPGTKARTADTDAFVETGVPDKGDPYQAVPRQSIAE